MPARKRLKPATPPPLSDDPDGQELLDWFRGLVRGPSPRQLRGKPRKSQAQPTLPPVDYTPKLARRPKGRGTVTAAEASKLVGERSVPEEDRAAIKVDSMLPAIEVALAKSGEAATWFGMLSVNDSGLVYRMRRGQLIKNRKRRQRILERVQYLNEGGRVNVPHDLEEEG